MPIRIHFDNLICLAMGGEGEEQRDREFDSSPHPHTNTKYITLTEKYAQTFGLLLKLNSCNGVETPYKFTVAKRERKREFTSETKEIFITNLYFPTSRLKAIIRVLTCNTNSNTMTFRPCGFCLIKIKWGGNS